MCLFFLIGLFIASIAGTALLLFYLHLSTDFMIIIIIIIVIVFVITAKIKSSTIMCQMVF